MRLLAGICCCLLAGLLMLQAWVVAAEKRPQEMLQSYCTVCHDLERVRQRVGSKDHDGWTELIGRMQGNGAKITDGEKEILAGHLADLVQPDF